MTHMRIPFRPLLLLGAISLLASSLPAQSGTGAVDFTARVTPTGGQPDPVRQFGFYVLTKSYAEIIRDVEGQDVLPTRAQFIDALTCSPELKTWMKAHNVVDLVEPDLNQLLTTDDIMKVPEFFSGYERLNSGGVTKGLPVPKYRESDLQKNPERYKKQREEFLAATRKFIDENPYTVQGIELQLIEINPRHAWDVLQSDHRRKIAQLAPSTAQTKYLAGKAETNLDGHALIAGLPPGNYWLSTLGADVSSGDRNLLWDVPFTVLPGQTAHLELSNLNATDLPKPAPPQ